MQEQALSEALSLPMGKLVVVILRLLAKLNEAYGEEKTAEILLKAVGTARSCGKK